jgi:hypothetical protein
LQLRFLANGANNYKVRNVYGELGQAHHVILQEAVHALWRTCFESVCSHLTSGSFGQAQVLQRPPCTPPAAAATAPAADNGPTKGSPDAKLQPQVNPVPQNGPKPAVKIHKRNPLAQASPKDPKARPQASRAAVPKQRGRHMAPWRPTTHPI